MVPFVENSAKEFAPCFGGYAEGSYIAILIKQVCQMSSVLMALYSLHHGSELQVLASQFVAKESVEIQGARSRNIVDHRHGIPLYIVSVQHVYALHYFLPCGTSIAFHAVGIVHVPGAVNANAHEPSLVVQEATPFRSEQGAICLDAVQYAFSFGILTLPTNHLSVILQWANHRLSTMPGKVDLAHELGLYVFADEYLCQSVRHDVLFATLI